MRRFAAIALLALSACTPQQAAPSPSPVPVPASSAQPGAVRPAVPVDVDLREVALRINVPARWTWNSQFASVNRATQRYFLAANGPLADLPGLPGNGDVDAAVLPSGRVVVAVESFCRLGCNGPATETPLPLDWSRAAPLFDRALPSDRHELAVGFRWFDQALFVVARWSDDALAADIAAIAEVVRSIRPEPNPPAAGEYRGWAGIGPLANIPVGSVTLTALPAGASLSQPNRSYGILPFYVVRGKQGIYAFRSRAFFDERCLIAYDSAADRLTCSVPGRVYEWTRFGRYLGPEPASDLTQHRVIVRDGQVWVRYSEDSQRFLSVADEAAEY